jgi:hypothetical protein
MDVDDVAPTDIGGGMFRMPVLCRRRRSHFFSYNLEQAHGNDIDVDDVAPTDVGGGMFRMSLLCRHHHSHSSFKC